MRKIRLLFQTMVAACANIAKYVARMLLSIEYLSWLELAE
jgi:hypothetical protein